MNERGPIRWNVEYIGFIDRAWKKSSNENVKSEIGGVLVDSSEAIVFTFAGCVNTDNPLLAEKEKKSISLFSSQG